MSLYFMYCSVNGSAYFVCCVFVNCLGIQFAICLGVVVILVVTVMEVFSVGGGALLDIYRVWSFKECACCACNPSVHLSVPFISSPLWSSMYECQRVEYVFTSPARTDVQLNIVLDTVVGLSGDDVCCSVVFDTLVGVFVLCGPS